MSSTGSAMELPSVDDRIYKTIVLPNDLEVLLISDPTTDKAAAALDVRVGQLCDGSMEGLAHFCEHMLFIGTEKFPDENEYNRYLNSHGGNSNAFTDLEDTNYYFDVTAASLEGALDRFAQFFIAPLFTESATKREAQAVDSEHSKNLQNDYWRLDQLAKSLAKPDHPYNHFGTGNLETLMRDSNIREQLVEFHAKHYSANLMKLVVLGADPVETLQTWVETYFSGIPNHSLPVPRFPSMPFDDKLPVGVQVVPVREHIMLDISFQLREVATLYRSKPTRYLSHLLGHEGKGSILALLKDKHWANELSAGESRSCMDWSSFSVSIDLTPEGLKHWQEVVEVVFAYLALLRKEGSQQWIYDETATVAQMQYQFLSKRNPMSFVSSLAGWMHQYPSEHFLSGAYKIYDFQPDYIKECLDCMTPQNMLLMLAAKDFEGETTEVEKWYGTQYKIVDLDESTLNQWSTATVDKEWMQPAVTLPERNDMIATDFSLRQLENAPKEEPCLLLDTPSCRLWYKIDNVFSMPKVNIMASIRTSVAYESPESSVCTALLVDILHEHCNEFAYLASMAGLHCDFSGTRAGIEIHVSGYNHKAHALLQRIAGTILSTTEKATKELFLRIKDKTAKEYYSFLVSQPYQHAMYGVDLCLDQPKWSIDDKLAALESMTYQDVTNLSKRVFSRFQLEMLVHGNASPTEAKNLASILIDAIKPKEPFIAHLPEHRVVKIDTGKDFIYRFAGFNESDTNNCLASVYQIGPIDINATAKLALLHHLMKEPAFHELRTEEQLGYVVQTTVKTNGDDVKSLLFLIQSDAYDPIHLDQRVEAFIERFQSKIELMSEEEFTTNIDAVVETFLEKNKNVGEESQRYWNVITNRTYMFTRRQMIAAEAKTLTKEQLLGFFMEHIVKGAPSRQKLSVQVFAKSSESRMSDQVSTAEVLLTDPLEFKRGSALFPLAPATDLEPLTI